jgi:hypothetical protein
VLQDDARVKAGAMLAAPPENPAVPGVSIASIAEPGLFLLAEEDNSIAAIGNDFIQQNYESYPAAAWLVRVKDAGHWSFSDVPGIMDAFAPGCGSGKRQTDPTQDFTYLDPAVGRSITQGYVTAFFGHQLLGDAASAEYLGRAKPESVVTVARR